MGQTGTVLLLQPLLLLVLSQLGAAAAASVDECLGELQQLAQQAGDEQLQQVVTRLLQEAPPASLSAETFRHSFETPAAASSGEGTSRGPFTFGTELRFFPNASALDVLGAATEVRARAGVGYLMQVESRGAAHLSLYWQALELRAGHRLWLGGASRLWRAPAPVAARSGDRRGRPSGALVPSPRVSLVPGPLATLLFWAPSPSSRGRSHLRLSSIVHAHFPVLHFGPKSAPPPGQARGFFGNSSGCSVDINCPLGSNWQAEKRAVVQILQKTALCTGTLLNSPNEPFTMPFVLTALHCKEDGAQVAEWCLVFNYEQKTCASSSLSNGFSDCIAGLQIAAVNEGYDLLLLQLDAEIPKDLEPYFAGWDSTLEPPPRVVTIHHPYGDFKKISTSDESPTLDSSFGGGSNSHWIVEKWDHGNTESGSSGAALFSRESHRVIGHLQGGDFGTCPGGPDAFGALVNLGVGLPLVLAHDEQTGEDLAFMDGTEDIPPLDPLLADPEALTLMEGGDIQEIAVSFKEALVSEFSVTLSASRPDIVFISLEQAVDGSFQGMDSVPLVFNQTTWNTSVTLFILPVDDTETNGTQFLSIEAQISPPFCVDDQCQDLQTFPIVLQDDDCINAPLSIIVEPDDFPGEVSWYLEFGNELIASVVGGAGDTTFSMSKVILLCTPGTYKLLVEDKGGDGICCGYGEGKVTVLLGDVVVASSTGEFFSELVLEITVETPDSTQAGAGLKGDCDGNGLLELADVDRLRSWLLEKKAPASQYACDLEVVDFNEDGWVNIGDCAAVLEAISVTDSLKIGE